MAGDFLFHAGHNAFGFGMAPVNHEPARTFRHGVAQKDDAKAENRTNAKREPPAEADGNNPHIQQHDACRGANGRSNPETGVDNQINASAYTRGDSSSMAELMAEYSPPMPAPVSPRNKA